MDVYKGMRIVSYVSVSFGTAAFFLTGWVFLTNRNITNNQADVLNKNETLNNTCYYHNQNNLYHHNDPIAYYQKSVQRSCIIIVIVSFIQIISAVGILLSPLQGTRQRAKIWFCINIGLNLILFLCFIVPLMNSKGINPEYQQQEYLLKEKNDPTYCTRSLTSSQQHIFHLDAYYISATMNFAVHFLILVFCLMMLRYDEDRDYELIAIV